MSDIVKGLTELGNALTNAMIQTLKDNGSYNTGQLAASITYDIRKQGTTYQLVRSMLDYGVFVDEGRGRGPGKQPPVRPIMEWIRLKNIPIPRQMDIESFAYAISKNIGKRGTDPKPRPFITPSIESVLSSGTYDYVLDMIEKQVEEQIDESL